MILDGVQAEAALQGGDADLIAVGREAPRNPYWAHTAAEQLGAGGDFSAWPVRHSAWLANRQQGMGHVIEARRRGLQCGSPVAEPALYSGACAQ